VNTLWRCPTCGRTFRRSGQTHSCRVVPLDEHFRDQPEARVLFDRLVAEVAATVGPCEVSPLRCCVHLSTGVDFLALLPKHDRVEVRFTLRDEVDAPRILHSTQISASAVKHSLEVR
jgi:hypothetical protein